MVALTRMGSGEVTVMELSDVGTLMANRKAPSLSGLSSMVSVTCVPDEETSPTLTPIGADPSQRMGEELNVTLGALGLFGSSNSDERLNVRAKGRLGLTRI